MDLTSKVRVYYNLRKRVFSIQTHTKGKGWRLSHHATSIYLRDVSFKVYESGRQRVLRDREKNVHAYIIGTPMNHPQDSSPVSEISYNPYKNTQFMIGGLTPIYKCNELYLEVSPKPRIHLIS